MDMNEAAKQKVLQQLIDMMDKRGVESMKSKSPKFMKVETNDPEMAKDVVEEVTGSEMPMPMESEMSEKPEMSEDDEDMKRLMEMYKQLK